MCPGQEGDGGVDPTYAQVYWSCKGASINPATGKLVDKRAVYVVFKERPYDGEADPDNTWPSRPCLSRTAITEDVGVKRQERTALVLGLHHTSAWYFNNTAPPSSLARCSRRRSTKQQFPGSGVA